MTTKFKYKAFLDTNFFINLLNPNNTFHKNAHDYFEVFLINQVELYTSSIVLAEYRVKGNITDLPLKNLKVMSFDIKHADLTGKLRKTILEHKGELHLDKRYIPDDTKLLAQAESLSVDCFVSADNRLMSTGSFLKRQNLIYYNFFDLANQCSTNLGFLPNMPIQEINLNGFFKSLQNLRKK